MTVNGSGSAAADRAHQANQWLLAREREELSAGTSIQFDLLKLAAIQSLNLYRSLLGTIVSAAQTEEELRAIKDLCEPGLGIIFQEIEGKLLELHRAKQTP